MALDLEPHWASVPSPTHEDNNHGISVTGCGVRGHADTEWHLAEQCDGCRWGDSQGVRVGGGQDPLVHTQPTGSDPRVGPRCLFNTVQVAGHQRKTRSDGVPDGTPSPVLHQAYPRRLRGGGGRRQRREQSPRPPSTHTDPKGHFSVLETCLGLSSHLNTPSPPRWLPGSHRSPKVGDAVPGHLARWHPCSHPAGARAAPSMKLRLCTPAPPPPSPTHPPFCCCIPPPRGSLPAQKVLSRRIWPPSVGGLRRPGRAGDSLLSSFSHRTSSVAPAWGPQGSLGC